MTETKKEASINSDLRAREVITAMYRDSNDKRRERNGRPDTLIDLVTGGKKKGNKREERNYITAGVYKLLTTEQKNLINDQVFRKTRECDLDSKQLSVRKEIISTVLKMYQEEKKDVFIRISDKGMAVLKTIVEGTQDDATKYFKLVDMFEIQERYKISGKDAH